MGYCTPAWETDSVSRKEEKKVTDAGKFAEKREDLYTTGRSVN